MKELGIYIHIPFCKRKCNYCDFISFQDKDNCIIKYVECLKEEINKTIKLSNYKEYTVKTIYIGGGTPSYIDSKFIVEIVNEIKEKFNVDKNAEITIEINPGAVNEKKLYDYYNVGINRLSIGLQSDNDELLKTIGRIHNFSEFLEIYKIARKIGYKNINIDLMLALPNQTIEMLENTVNNIIRLNPEHISLYSLIVEEGTKLEKQLENKELTLPNEDTERIMYHLTRKILYENKYIQYEISNFSKIGYESKHNLDCWSQKEYIGVGLASHSYINMERFSNITNIDEYITNIQNNKIEENYITHEKQNLESQMKEYMILGLRKINGVNITEFKLKFNQNPIYLFRMELNNLVNKGLIEIQENNIKLTNKGLDFANIVWEEFI